MIDRISCVIGVDLVKEPVKPDGDGHYGTKKQYESVFKVV
jgi:hypothetical protein